MSDVYLGPGMPVLESGEYAAVTPAGHLLDMLFVAAGSCFPSSQNIAGPGVSVRYVLVKPSTYRRISY